VKFPYLRSAFRFKSPLGALRRAAPWAVLLSLPGLATAASATRPNVLFIAIDDLRGDLGVLGVAHAQTPQLDRLAHSSRLFTHHYTQVPTCGASRCALLRGLYPTAPAYVGNNAILETHAAWQAESLPAWLRQQGYATYALGKITHYPGGLTGKDWNELPEELPGAWTRCWLPDSPWKTPLAIMHGYANGKPRKPGVTPPWEAVDGPDETYPDAWIAGEAVAQLRRLAAGDTPWFFAVGFFKPHLPFAAPRSWHDRHAHDDIPAPEVAPGARSGLSWSASGEMMRNYFHDGRDPREDPAYAAQLRRAYAAGVSYTDAQVGRVLDTLKELGLAEDTIVVLWSDHGFLTGEHAMWGKHTLYETALRSPLMIRYPGLPAAGKASDAIVETVDLYPTLLDLCGLPAPAHLDGRSLRPQLEDPSAPTAKPAQAWWGKGRSLRNDRWHLIAYPGKTEDAPAVELFDMVHDRAELTNVAPAHPDVVSQLMSRLKRGAP